MERRDPVEYSGALRVLLEGIVSCAAWRPASVLSAGSTKRPTIDVLSVTFITAPNQPFHLGLPGIGTASAALPNRNRQGSVRRAESLRCVRKIRNSQGARYDR